jgi:transposase
MKEMKRRRFSAEFKRNAVRLSEIGDKPINQLEKELGLSKGQLSHWRRTYLEEGEKAFETRPRSAIEQELQALRRENARLREEQTILKKVLSMFSQAE